MLRSEGIGAGLRPQHRELGRARSRQVPGTRPVSSTWRPASRSGPFGIPQRQCSRAGGRGQPQTSESARLSSPPASQQALTRARQRLTSTNSLHLCEWESPMCCRVPLTRLEGWVCSVAGRLAPGECPACFCSRDRTGQLQASAGGQQRLGAEKPEPSETSPCLRRGRPGPQR